MNFELKYGLPFTSVAIEFRSQWVAIPDVLIDTGSAKSIFSIDYLEKIGIYPEANDPLRKVHGIGGIEIVFEKQIDSLRIDDCFIHFFIVQVGSMDYGYDINGIVGMDFLGKSLAVIDIQNSRIDFHK